MGRETPALFVLRLFLSKMCFGHFKIDSYTVFFPIEAVREY